MTARLAAQDTNAPKPESGHITGTVSDVNNDTLSGATVVLEGSGLKDPRKVLSDDNGFFEFDQLDPGTYRVTITGKEFANWTSPDFTVHPGQYLILENTKLRVAEAMTTVNVLDSPEEVATEQVEIEEKQRIFGLIPNFYVVYDPNPVPLTTKLKFQLAVKSSTDVVTILGIAVLAAMNQAGNTPDYVQGWKGYGERFGAAAADSFSDIMIGGAILPSLLHQDPRYYYQGTGTNKSRTLHALSSPFVARTDQGESQANYSSVGGVLASSSLANLYYPRSNRGVGLVFGNFAIGIAERIGANVAQEFLLGRFTRRGGHLKGSE